MMVCVGLTPTVQRTQFFARLLAGEVNRAMRTLTTASGKAVNVARVLDTLGAPVCLVQPLGGDSGRYVHANLPFPQSVVWVEDDAPTRTCCTLLDQSAHQTTELVEEAAPLSRLDTERVVAQVQAQLPGARALALSGSLPPGVAPELYAGLCQSSTVPVVLDAQKEPLRRALQERPYLVKPNRQETIAALGLSEASTARDCARALCDAGAQNALVSEGSAGAVLLTEGKLWRVLPPTLTVCNPIGSGDSLMAGILFRHFVVGDSLEQAVRFGTACAAANCLTPTSGVVDCAVVNQLLPQVVLESVQ